MKSIKLEFIVVGALLLTIVGVGFGLVYSANSAKQDADNLLNNISQQVFDKINLKNEVPAETLNYDKEVAQEDVPSETLDYQPGFLKESAKVKDTTSVIEENPARVKGKVTIAQLLEHKTFKMAIDLGLLIMAGFAWFTYFAEFQPEEAFKKVIHPATMTFMAFQWVDLIKWLGVM